MGPSALWLLYRNRLRAQLREEVLALFGIAIGVALVLAVLVANQSIRGSVGSLVHGIVGRASLELHARDVNGFDQRLYGRVERISSVRSAAPVLERRVTIVGPGGERSVTLFGADPRLKRLGGSLVRNVESIDATTVSLPEAVGRPLGLHPGQRLTLHSGERSVTATVGALLSREDVGGLARSPIAVTSLSNAQRLTGMPGRVTHILVEPRADLGDDAQRALGQLAGDRLDVRPSDAESALVRQAAKSNDQTSLLFSAISAGVGLLFVYNAMLLTLPMRRRIYAEMRLLGFRRGQVLASLLFETAILSAVGVGVGLVLGDVVSRVLFGETPRYLASAFAIGTERVVTGTTVATACALGVAAAFAAAARPLRELYAVEPMEATQRLALTEGEDMSGRRPHLLFWSGLGLLGAITAVALAVPSAGLVAATSCALAAVAVLPLLLRLVVRGASALTWDGHRRAMAWVAVRELAATPTRATALAAIAAVAVFGITTVEGARRDLIRGADAYANELAASGAVHVLAGSSDNYLALEPFHFRRVVDRLRSLPVVRSVAVHRGELLDVGDRRLAIFARPAVRRQLEMATALRDRSLGTVAARLRAGGWAVVSSRVAEERGLSVGERFRLPTPSGVHSFRLAATTTNYFWPPGAVVLGVSDYARLWGPDSAGELMVDLRPGVSPEAGRHQIAAALRPWSGLRVITADQRAAEIGAIGRQALTTLGQIRVLVLACAVLAVAAAMGAAVWQRRRRLAALKTVGFHRGQLLRLIGAEAVMLLTIGGVVGAAFGLYAQVLASRWTELTSGSSVSYMPAWNVAVGTVAVLVALATAVVVLPGRLATNVPPRAAFSE